MASSFDLPSAILRPTKAWVFLSVRSRLIAIMCRARLAWRLPPRLSRCRLVLPDDAGSGEVPQSMAQAASEPKPLGVVTCGHEQLAGGLDADAGPLGVVTCGHEQLAGGLDADAGPLEEPGTELNHRDDIVFDPYVEKRRQPGSSRTPGCPARPRGTRCHCSSEARAVGATAGEQVVRPHDG